MAPRLSSAAATRDTPLDHLSILQRLRDHRVAVERQFGVRQLALFGSAARGELREDSDVDVLVAFDGPTTVARYFGLKDYLEALLGRRVDLVTERGLRPRARLQVERDRVNVA